MLDVLGELQACSLSRPTWSYRDVHIRVAQGAFQSWETTALKNHVTRLICSRGLPGRVGGASDVVTSLIAVFDSSVCTDTSDGEHPPCTQRGRSEH